ncbi:NAD(P)-binding protein [Ganoderma leucocontextum]|nr:NAD(P)-binding protein [Ganoderma leucocontextum]
MALPLWLSLAASIFLLFYLYVRANDAKITRLTSEAALFSPKRWTLEDVKQTARSAALTSPSPSLFSPEELSPKTGRRYIVVGGAGFLGGWIVLHLIARGEDPRRIRILDIRRPIRQDLLEGPAAQVDFCQVDIADVASVEGAFRKPWADIHDGPEPELTVFHTAAIIRFYERDESLQHISDRINLAGTQTVVAAARKAGASTFLYTSSGSVSVRSNRFFRWPWEGPPEFFVQPINDDDERVPKRHEHFFSNYAHSKWKAEQFVRAADRSPSGGRNGVMRTGCIRPGNGIYGPGGDLMLDPHMHRKSNPSWIFNILQSFIHVENCSVAHLAYEQRLIELERGSTNPNPDIGGQAFCIADAGPPVTYGEVYRGITELSKGEVTFTPLSATVMLAFAMVVECYYLARHALLRAPAPFSALAKLVPALNGGIVFLQPSMWSLTQVHLIFDDSRARAPPAEGGLGYNGHVTTLQGICKGVAEYQKTGSKAQQRVIAGHPTSDFGFDLTRAEKGVEEVIEKLGGGHRVDAKPQVAELHY